MGRARRPLKKAHLRRWLGRSSLRRTTAYASVVAPSPPSIWTFFSGLLLLAVSGALFFFDVGARVLATNDETRFPLLARDILARSEWLLPQLNGRVYLNKPPLCA